MKKVLITGATGFVGRHLAEHFLAKGYQVTGLCRHAHAKKSRISLIKVDMTDPRQIKAAVSASRPDWIFHLAAQSIARSSWEMEKETLTVNTAGTIHLLNAVRQSAPKARILFASSNHVYGKIIYNKETLTEHDLMWPENPYGASKALAELACRDFISRFGIHVIIVRAFNQTGRGQLPHFVFPDWCRQIALAEIGRASRVLQVGNLNVQRDFLHVSDVVNAYEILLEKGKSGEVYNLCSGRPQPLRDYLDFLLREAKIKMKVEVRADRLRAHDPKKIAAYPDKMFALDWRPKRNAFEALEEMLEEWRQKVRHETC